MPRLINPTDGRLACRLGFTLDAGESVQITDEQADAVMGTVFIVERAKRTADAVAENNETPKRETVKRAAKRAEVTAKPEMETRG